MARTLVRSWVQVFNRLFSKVKLQSNEDGPEQDLVEVEMLGFQSCENFLYFIETFFKNFFYRLVMGALEKQHLPVQQAEERTQGS